MTRPLPQPEPAYRRPWWLLVNKSPQLITTIKEETRPDERVFMIYGEPLVQGLGWLTWGPVGALLVILMLVGLAVALEMSAQSWGSKALFIVAFLALPVLAWGGVALLITRISQKFVQAERQVEAQSCLIGLRQKSGELFYQTSSQSQAETLAYQTIRQAKVTHPVGGRDHQTLLLTLETEHGPVILLNERLGSQNQKMDLVHEIQQALKDFADNKNIPPQ